MKTILGCNVCGKPITADEYHMVTSIRGTEWFCPEHGPEDRVGDPVQRHQELMRLVLDGFEALNRV